MTSKAHQLPPLSNAAAETPEENVVAWKAVQIGSRAVEAVRNYRPESKLILRTSLILLLLLQPFFILGSMLVTVLLTFACYFYAGSDRFWRKIIRAYGALAKRQPDIARSLKLRAYVISRQWDSIVGHLPERIADAWRSPDLRSLVRADENHARAMNKRLDRLY